MVFYSTVKNKIISIAGKWTYHNVKKTQTYRQIPHFDSYVCIYACVYLHICAYICMYVV